VVIQILFVLLIVGTAALIAVCLAIHFRVRRQLRQEQIDAQVRSTLQEAATTTIEE
jgi:type II secretory pathway pseudopilin PulG